jgi:YD repeat-containing protein
VGQKFEKNNRYIKEKSYLWASNDRLLQIIIGGKVKRFDYDGWGNLSKTIFEDGNVSAATATLTGRATSLSDSTAKTGSTSAVGS